MNNTANQKPIILLAEDSEDLALVIVNSIKKAGFHIIHVNNGVEALHVLEGDAEVAVFITDIMMPGIHGLDLIDIAKKKDILPPTLIVSAKRQEADILAGIELGALDYLTKPFSPAVLSAKIKALFSTNDVM